MIFSNNGLSFYLLTTVSQSRLLANPSISEPDRQIIRCRAATIVDVCSSILLMKNQDFELAVIHLLFLMLFFIKVFHLSETYNYGKIDFLRTHGHPYTLN